MAATTRMPAMPSGATEVKTIARIEIPRPTAAQPWRCATAGVTRTSGHRSRRCHQAGKVPRMIRYRPAPIRTVPET